MTSRAVLRAARLAAVLCLTLPATADAADNPVTPEPQPPSKSCTLEPGPRHAVARVIDAETIALDDRTEVRLIGALAPRAPMSAGADAGGTSWPPEQEAKAALEELVAGRTVELAFGGRRTDRYGRMLAHVFVVEGAERTWVQGELLAKGHARAYGLPQSFLCLDELTAHERLARAGGLGIWTNPAYAPHAATDLASLRRLRSTFQLVVGQIANVRQTKSATYLNFGPDWHRDFSATVRIKKLDASTREMLAGLGGRTVLVRGWIERRGGPFIAIDDISQLEVLPDGAGPGDIGPAVEAPQASVQEIVPETGTVGAEPGTGQPQQPSRRSRRSRAPRVAPGAI